MRAPREACGSLCGFGEIEWGGDAERVESMSRSFGGFAKIAVARRERRENLRMNSSHRCLLDGFKFNGASILKLLFVFVKWGILELREGWRSWGPKRQAPTETVRPALES